MRAGHCPSSVQSAVEEEGRQRMGSALGTCLVVVVPRESAGARAMRGHSKLGHLWSGQTKATTYTLVRWQA